MANYQDTIEIVRGSLTEVFEELDGWFERPTELLAYKPENEGWSIEQILEHVTLTSHFLLLVIRKGVTKAVRRAATQPIDRQGESDLTRLAPIGHPDAFPWLRPEHMEPARVKTLPEVRSIMRDQKEETLRLLAELAGGQGSLYTVRMSVQDLGKLDLYQWLYFLALHARRHLAQVEQVAREYENSAAKLRE